MSELPSKNILVLSNYLPLEGWGGGVIIRSLTKNHPKNLNFFWTTHIGSNSTGNLSYNNIQILDYKAKLLRGKGLFKFIHRLENIFFAKDLNALLKKHKIDLLWIVLGTTFFELDRLNTLINGLEIPYHVSVHDDPILEINKDKELHSKKLFKRILQKATTIDTISSRMQKQYKELYSVDSIVITRSIPNDFVKNNKLPDQLINVLMGGYGNASPPWPNNLIEATNKLNNQTKTLLHIFDPKLKPLESDIVKTYDLIDEDSFNKLLETTHIGYAVDDLDPAKIKFAQLSLPTKVITYIGAEIPFIYHGPLDSTVSDLMQKYKVGIIVSSNNPEELYQAFLTLLKNYSYFQDNCKLATKNLFSEIVVNDKFYKKLVNK